MPKIVSYVAFEVEGQSSETPIFDLTPENVLDAVQSILRLQSFNERIHAAVKEGKPVKARVRTISVA